MTDMVTHPTDLELCDWLDGKLLDTTADGEIARHVISCRTCAALLLGQGDVAYKLLQTSWRELVPQSAPVPYPLPPVRTADPERLLASWGEEEQLREDLPEETGE